MTMTLVTGATGNVGSKVVGELRRRGIATRAFVRDAPSAAALFGGGVEIATGDLSDASSLRSALDGVDVVFLSTPNHPCQVAYETAVIDAATAARVQRIVKLSAIGAQVGSSLAFWDAHGVIEQHLERSGVPAVVLRPSFYMTNLFGAASTVREAGRLFAPLGGARIGMIDPIDVAEVAAIAMTASDTPHAPLTLTGPEAIGYDRVAEALSAALDRPVEFMDVPEHVARANLAGSGMPEWVVDQLMTLFAKLRGGATDAVTDTVRVLTGREPRSVAQFTRDNAACFQS